MLAGRFSHYSNSNIVKCVVKCWLVVSYITQTVICREMLGGLTLLKQ